MSSRGARMVEAMQLRGMTKQHALAFAMGVNESTVTRWKNNGPISVDHAVLLCGVLEISLDWFLTGRGRIDGHKAAAACDSDESRLLTCVRRAEARMSERSKAHLIAFITSLCPEASDL
ncbi:XRE family transcriptional regulator [Rhodopseudomonas sp. WA056]|uniref:helix-turn-helix domain-containing protein n=1 Tax=Rhodopseudomonas sp. WA056 TaxID=2269367 RepID=UPI0013DEAA89|nr:helix-turn-helix transcriptional regulator [Rhodopseudomonas sp. WA056]NEW87239.1 XRE family transcriptional regulator [Rhodopseudomonas sp. WA056]